MQNSANPAFIPRNHVMQDAIALAEEGDYSEVSGPQVSHTLKITFSYLLWLNNCEDGVYPLISVLPGIWKQRIDEPCISAASIDSISS